MRWAIFGIFAALGLVFDAGMASALALETIWNIRPSLCAVLGVFIALSAPRGAALWACFVLGLLLDLSEPLTMPGDRVLHLVGPYTLGFVAGGWLIVGGRTMVFRQRPLTVGVMTVLFLLVVHAVAVMLYVVRTWYPGGPVYWTDVSTAVAILRRILIAAYSGVVALPLGWLLLRSMPLWGFQTITHRSPSVLKKA